MASSDTKAAPLSFPDFTVAISYEQAQEYVQMRLGMIAQGGVKTFCFEHKLPYPTTISLKNNKLAVPQPLLMHRLLSSLGVPTELVRHPTQGKKTYYLFPTREALATFRQQLSSLTVPPEL